MIQHMRFWLNTILHYITPGGYGYNRQLRRYRDPAYVHDRDKHPVRDKHKGGSGWESDARDEQLTYRGYANYDEYVLHQRQKFEEIIKARGGFSNRKIASFRFKFYRRFRHLPQLLSPTAVIICCGARQGTEVEVLHDLGFRNATGIDLNPGPDNYLVRPGDFMNLDAADRSIDLIYSNSIDHAFDLNKMFREHARALKEDGFVLYDIADQDGGAFEAVSWNEPNDIVRLLLDYFADVVKVEQDRQWKWILMRGVRLKDKE